MSARRFDTPEKQHEHWMEIAGRELCKARGEDADEKVCHGGPGDVLLYSPRWKLAAREVLDFFRLKSACEHATTRARLDVEIERDGG